MRECIDVSFIFREEERGRGDEKRELYTSSLVVVAADPEASSEDIADERSDLVIDSADAFKRFRKRFVAVSMLRCIVVIVRV